MPTDPLRLAEEIEAHDRPFGGRFLAVRSECRLIAAALKLAEAVSAQGEWVAAIGGIRCLWCHGERPEHRANCSLSAYRSARQP